jgi:hypothetical protein
VTTYIVLRELEEVSQDDVRDDRGHVLKLPFQLVLMEVAQEGAGLFGFRLDLVLL